MNYVNIIFILYEQPLHSWGESLTSWGGSNVCPYHSCSLQAIVKRQPICLKTCEISQDSWTPLTIFRPHRLWVWLKGNIWDSPQNQNDEEANDYWDKPLSEYELGHSHLTSEDQHIPKCQLPQLLMNTECSRNVTDDNCVCCYYSLFLFQARDLHSPKMILLFVFTSL